jgi:hypothetical protein
MYASHSQLQGIQLSSGYTHHSASGNLPKCDPSHVAGFPYTAAAARAIHSLID